jgi:hypothetical protein
MKMLNLLGDDGCIEEGFFRFGAGEDYAVFRCRYCKTLLPEAGLGLAFWTRRVLLGHLKDCAKAPQEVRDEALLESRTGKAVESQTRRQTPYSSADDRIFIHIDDPRAVCPICGAMFKWSCVSDPHESSGGTAHCQDGRMVSRRMDKNGKMHMLNDRAHPSCRWAGTRTYRLSDGEVYVRWPFHLTLLPEATLP